MSVEREEGAVTQRAVPGPALYFVSAIPEGAKAIVGVLPGYADHAARYVHVMDHWAERAIGTVALDMRGHGRAAGTRGYCARFDEFLDDAAELARLVSDRAHGAPVFLFGHSFGGLVAALSVLEQARSWRGLILSSPYFGLAMQVPPVKTAVGKIAGRLIPKLALSTGIKGSDLTHDEKRGKAYEEDPLVFKEARARWFVEATRAQERALARAHDLTMPLYAFFGTADPVAKLAAGKAFFDGAASKDKTWTPLEGLRHETLNEPEWPDIASKIADWVLLHA
jgi:alpha-beta hydrolase superfamily lysophospholipase